jgi:predicted nucleotidyltransferase component of viral defense system
MAALAGGTSLSKGFGLINRFSEDIDVTVFRDDIGEPATNVNFFGLKAKPRVRNMYTDFGQSRQLAKLPARAASSRIRCTAISRA